MKGAEEGTTHRLLSTVSEYLKSKGIGAGSSILTAVSGGPDSTALLRLLHQCAKRQGFSLFAAYVQHNIRTNEECLQEKSLVESLCSELDVELFIEELDKGFIASKRRNEKKGLEEAARIIRYGFFFRLMQELNIPYLATGHNLNERIETIVMRFFQGAGIEGLRGISEQRSLFDGNTGSSYSVIRPLLTVHKNEITTYLHEIGAEYISDSTNTHDVYLRNAVRMHLIPEVRKNFPYFEGSLLRLSSELGEIIDFLSDSDNRFPSWHADQGGYSIPSSEYLNMHYVMRMRSLYAAYNTWKRRGTENRLPLRFLKEFDEKAACMKDGDQISGHGITLGKKGGYFFWKSPVARNKKKGYLFIVQEKQELVFDEGSAAALLFTEGWYSTSAFSISKKMVSGSLVVRSRRTGDEIITDSGRKPIKKVFSEAKVAKHNRDNVPIIEDRLGIIAVLSSIYGSRDICSVRCSRVHSSEIPVLSCVIRYNGVSG